MFFMSALLIEVPAWQSIGVQLFHIDLSVFSDALAWNVMLFHYRGRSDKLGLFPQGTDHSLGRGHYM